MDRCTSVPLADDPHQSDSAWLATEIVLSSRKTWKTMRSKTEKVWPPYLESALIEGLEKYRPQSVRNIALLQRFPKRNCWIAEYIKKVTGQERSPKQVGSRLQQLRDSCPNERILQLLNRRRYDQDAGRASDSGSSTSSASSPCSSQSSNSLSSAASSPGAMQDSDAVAPEAETHTIVSIDLMNPSSADIGNPGETSQTFINLDFRQISLAATSPSWKTDPVVSLLATRRIETSEHHSFTRVLVEGTLIHSERTNLTLLSVSTQFTGSISSQTFLYGTKSLTHIWTSLYRTINFSQCEIIQQIVRRKRADDHLSLNEDAEDRVVHTVTYRFTDHRQSAPSTNDSGSSHSSGLSLSSQAASKQEVNLVRSIDALGLDAPALSPDSEAPFDGRAHYPVKAVRTSAFTDQTLPSQSSVSGNSTHASGADASYHLAHVTSANVDYVAATHMVPHPYDDQYDLVYPGDSDWHQEQLHVSPHSSTAFTPSPPYSELTASHVADATVMYDGQQLTFTRADGWQQQGHVQWGQQAQVQMRTADQHFGSATFAQPEFYWDPHHQLQAQAQAQAEVETDRFVPQVYDYPGVLTYEHVGEAMVHNPHPQVKSSGRYEQSHNPAPNDIVQDPLATTTAPAVDSNLMCGMSMGMDCHLPPNGNYDYCS